MFSLFFDKNIKDMEKENNEIWREIPGYEGYYEASNLGRVRSLDRTVITKRGERFYKGKIMEGSDISGYKILTLSRDGKQKYFYIHQAVAMTYLNHTPNGYSLVIDHINGIKTDNRVENLRIVTNRDNNSVCFRKDRNSLSSNFTGVSYFKPAKNFRAQIIFKNKTIYLGLFNNEEDASNAYQQALGELENGIFKIEDYRVSFTSNFKGVSYHKTTQKWQARPYINGKQIYLGLFSSEEEAFQAILEYEASNLTLKNIDKNT